MGGAEYFVTFIDSHSHYTWVYVLKRKSEVLETFRSVRILLLVAFSGGEYTSEKFREHLDQKGIRHETTVPLNKMALPNG